MQVGEKRGRGRGGVDVDVEGEGEGEGEGGNLRDQKKKCIYPYIQVM